jgi:hypothetical protein
VRERERESERERKRERENKVIAGLDLQCQSVASPVSGPGMKPLTGPVVTVPTACCFEYNLVKLNISFLLGFLTTDQGGWKQTCNSARLALFPWPVKLVTPNPTVSSLCPKRP